VKERTCQADSRRRWTESKAKAIAHVPLGHEDIIDSISLSYAPFVSRTETLNVGDRSPEVKMSHRAKYEALLAATTRPPPYVLSMGMKGVVKSDPFGPKVSKGFWGPGTEGKACRIEFR